jgi:uncharacterized OB-fold protein
VSAERLLPVIDEDAEPFFEGARCGELRLPRCRDSGRLIFPPRPISPWGRRREPEWVRVSGRGTIWSWIVPHPPLLPWFAARAPYNVILVALEEDPSVRLVGNLIARPGGEIGEVDPSEIYIGAPVRVSFEPVTDEIHLPHWVLE